MVMIKKTTKTTERLCRQTFCRFGWVVRCLWSLVGVMCYVFSFIEKGVLVMDILTFITLNAAMLLLTFMSYVNKEAVVRPHVSQTR